MVADPDGRGPAAFWIARDFCLRLWRWTVYLHSFLNSSKGRFAPQGILPWLYPYLVMGGAVFLSLSIRLFLIEM